MRKKDKEITDTKLIEAVIQRCQVCRIGLSDNGIPYVVPVCFGYRDRTVFIHCATEGRKIDIINRNDRVCVEFDSDYELVKGDHACAWGMRYRSVIAWGRASLIEDLREKREALDTIMAHYAAGSFKYPKRKLAITAIIAVKIEEMTGKQSGY
jgi:nitroimidazol reductase NimA-like FMN-containing flavoprotein (pyridoxamine 5'-phosphate oxidase superfamily)